MLAMLSFSALLGSILLVQISIGGLGPLDALAGVGHGFTTGQIGLLGSAHFLGFFVGCWLAPRLMGRVGAARSFAVFAVVGAISVMLHPLFIDPLIWALLRMGSGFMVAGAYTVIEGWFQSRVSNVERGRVFGYYRMTDLMGSLVAQGIVGILNPMSHSAYIILAAVAMLALLPTALTTSQSPVMRRIPRLKPGLVFQVSPLAAAGILVAGITGSSLRMVGPVYGLSVGLTSAQVGLFLMSTIIGGALVQPLVGWLADKFDRRAVLMAISICAVVICGLLSLSLFGDAAGVIYIAGALFGATAFPIYSVSAAHANDYVGDDADARLELNAGLIFLFGAGAIVSPIASAQLITLFGAPALFVYMALAHLGLLGYALYRATRRPTSDDKTPYQYLPRTSATVGQLSEGNKDK